MVWIGQHYYLPVAALFLLLLLAFMILIEPTPEPEPREQRSLPPPQDIDEYVRCKGAEIADGLRRQRGAAGVFILELLVAASIGLVVLAAEIPNVAATLGANQQNQAWETLTAINKAEGFYLRIFGNGYQTPAFLSGNGTVAARACDTPEVLGANYSAPFAATSSGGYVFVFTPGSAAPTGGGCTNPGYVSYTLTATPTAPGRYSFYTDNSATIRYRSDSQPATATDSVLNW
jgi:hypothetical protein